MSAMPTTPGTDDDPVPVIDTSRPHPARMYDWFLGGKDNYPVDEALGRRMVELQPGIRVSVKANRAFMHRATRWLAGQGVRQFLDIGTGIPTEPNLHQVAQEAAPEARVVYCDNDPIVLRHAEALLHGTPEGALDYLQADARDSAGILERAARALDFGRPVALSLNALLHFLSDEDGAYEVVRTLTEALAPGSYVAISHATMDFLHEKESRDARDAYNSQVNLTLRTREQFARFFDGLDIVEPGITIPQRWHPELGDAVPGQDDFAPAIYAAVARKM